MELLRLKSYLAGPDAFSELERKHRKAVTDTGQPHAVQIIIGILELPRIKGTIQDLEAYATEIWLMSDESLVFMHVIGEGKSEPITLKKGAKFQAKPCAHGFTTIFRREQAVKA